MFDDGGDPTGFVEFVNAVCDQSRRKKDEQIAGDLEEFFEVEPGCGGKERPAQENGRPKPERHTCQGLYGVIGKVVAVARKEGGGDKEGEFHAFAHHGDERQPKDGAFSGGGGSFVYAFFELGLDVLRLLAHPEDHPGQDARGEKHGDAFVDFLGGPFETETEGGEQDGGEGADSDRPKHAEPKRGFQVIAADLFQCAEYDADDEGGFQAFAQGE